MSSVRNSRAKESSSQSLPASQHHPTSGLTLPQVISVIDKRLINLELLTATHTVDPNVEEFETRFEILAEEISNLKQIVLSLQSYTMDVNKMLLEERQNVVKPHSFEMITGIIEEEI